MAANKKSQSKSKYKSFDWNDSLIVAIQKRTIGHAKTSALLSRVVMRSTNRASALGFLSHLSNLGFYGEDIWYGFENYCQSDEPMFEACVEIEDKGFYNFILDYKAEQALRALKGKD